MLYQADAAECFQFSHYHTSVCGVKLYAKVSIRSSGVVAGGEDDATNGFVLPDHTGNGRCGHDPLVSNDQTTDLRRRHRGELQVFILF